MESIEIRRTADRIEGGAGGRFRWRQMERSKADALTPRRAPRVRATATPCATLPALRRQRLRLRVLDRARRARRRGRHAADLFKPTSLERYEPSSVPFSAWILRVAHNAAIDHLRAGRSMRGGPQRGRAVLGHRARALDDLARRSTRCRTTSASDVEAIVGLSPGEIAERLGRTGTPCTRSSTAAAAACRPS
jgi:hypothetical protein